jgi:hypothetical protein
MANNYVLFSQSLEAPQEALDWLEEEIERLLNEGDNTPPCECRRNSVTEVVLFSEDYCNLEVLIETICRMQQRFHQTEPWGLEWAATCDQPRIGEFGGGAVCCHEGEATWLTTSGWLENQIKTLRTPAGNSQTGISTDQPGN